ncbi:MAG: hypothetical protein P4L41_03035 [Flavipsychrobacter sp.]|nr:hypothetical protein [Flavipsychrobacter sp.]
MKKVTSLITAFILLVSYQQCLAQNYNRIMGRAIKRAVGKDLRGFQTFSYPTDNFGLITSYVNSVSPENFICDMWNCIGVNSTAGLSSIEWLKMKDFAGVGSGGAITLSQQRKTKLAINVLLPKIYDVIGITGGFSAERTTNITISIGQAYFRNLRKDPMTSYINGLDNSSSLKKAYLNGNLVLIVSDCVIEDLSVSVTVNSEDSAKINAKFGDAATSKIFSDASLSVEVDRSSTGTYTFKVSHPIIFARLAKKQPSAGTLGAENNFDSWKSIVVTEDPSKLKRHN